MTGHGVLLYPSFLILGYFGYPAAYYVGLGCLLQGVPYILIGLRKDKSYVIPISEYIWGGVIGLMLSLSIML
jgi:hypothetical protein